MNISAPDLNTAPPRSGRDMLGRYTWLARLADKVRADHAGKQGEYIAYCGLSTGFLDRTGVSVDDFDAEIRSGASDAPAQMLVCACHALEAASCDRVMAEAIAGRPVPVRAINCDPHLTVAVLK